MNQASANAKTNRQKNYEISGEVEEYLLIGEQDSPDPESTKESDGSPTEEPSPVKEGKKDRPEKSKQAKRKGSKLIRQKNEIIRLILLEMKNGGKEDSASRSNRTASSAPGTAPTTSSLSTSQKEKIGRYVRFFRRFGNNKKSKHRLADRQPNQGPLQSLDASGNQKADKAKDYQNMVSEILDYRNLGQQRRRETVGRSNKESSRVGNSSRSSSAADLDDQIKNAESCSDLDDQSCGEVDVEPDVKNRASGVYVSSGTLRQIPNRNPTGMKKAIPPNDKKESSITFEYNCKELSERQPNDGSAVDTMESASFVQQFEANLSLNILKERRFEATPDEESPHLFSESMSIKSLSELSNVYDPFKDDLQEDLHQFQSELRDINVSKQSGQSKKAAGGQRNLSNSHFNLLIDDDDVEEGEVEDSLIQESPSATSPKEKPVKQIEEQEFSMQSPKDCPEDLFFSQWQQDVVIEEVDEEDEEDGEDAEYQELAYKEVFYELINNAILQNKHLCVGDLDLISERSNEDVDLENMSTEEIIDQLYVKNVLMQE